MYFPNSPKLCTNIQKHKFFNDYTYMDNNISIYEHLKKQKEFKNKKNIQSGGGEEVKEITKMTETTNDINTTETTNNTDNYNSIIKNINDNNNTRKQIELSLCIYKQLNNYNINNVKNIVSKINNNL